MSKLSELTETVFDGINHPYVPPKQLKISPKLRLHRDFSDDFDPVTFEVIRHHLWNVNEEHGATIQRVSGSPVAMYALDLNPSILTEDAEFVFFGPYMQYMSGVTDTQVKWILENPQRQSRHPRRRHVPRQRPLGRRRASAGRDADLPGLLPKGELFCWVTNCLHQYDIGGITPAASARFAESAFDEGILIPPVKIIEGNEIRRDIEETLSALLAQARAGGARFPRPDGGQHHRPRARLRS